MSAGYDAVGVGAGAAAFPATGRRVPHTGKYRPLPARGAGQRRFELSMPPAAPEPEPASPSEDLAHERSFLSVEAEVHITPCATRHCAYANSGLAVWMTSRTEPGPRSVAQTGRGATPMWRMRGAHSSGAVRAVPLCEPRRAGLWRDLAVRTLGSVASFRGCINYPRPSSITYPLHSLRRSAERLQSTSNSWTGGIFQPNFLPHEGSTTIARTPGIPRGQYWTYPQFCVYM